MNVRIEVPAKPVVPPPPVSVLLTHVVMHAHQEVFFGAFESERDAKEFVRARVQFMGTLPETYKVVELPVV